MRALITLSAFAGLYAGGRHFLNFMKQQGKNRLQARKLEAREGEGGAQVKPRKRRAASPRGVS